MDGVVPAKQAPQNGASVLRVGFDARWHNDSGVGTYVAGLLRALAARREIALIVYENPENAVPGFAGLAAARIAVRSARYSLSAQWEFKRRAREDSLHLFHSPFFDIPLALNCPVVATVHDLIPFLFRIYSWPKQQMVKAGYRMAARRAAHLIAVSQNTARDLETLLRVTPERISVAHHGASQDCFHPRASADDMDWLKQHGARQPYVVTASARNWHTKNLESALRSLQSLDQVTGMSFQTVVYGPADGFLAAGGVEKWPALNLVYLGHMPPERLAALFRHAAAFVMPSLYEGFGLPVLEAMACGCPVVTSNGGSLPEIAAGGAQLFDPLDCAGMRSALAALLLDPDERDRWKNKALQRAADFSWDKAAGETIGAYRQALTSR